MLHNELFDIFKLITHIPKEQIEAWYPNGLDSIRVKLVSGKTVVLTYKSHNYWKIETLDSFLDSWGGCNGL